MNVAVIGTGNIGGTIGGALATAGHKVWYGSRRAGGTAPGTEAGAEVATIGDAIAAADVVVVAVPGRAVHDLTADHGAALAGKLVVDATNTMGGPGPAHSADVFATRAREARYARAFNTLGWENFAQPRFGDVQADLFFSGPAADRATLEELISAVGLNPIYLGEDQQDVVDCVTRLWITLAMGQKYGRHLAFKVLHD